MDYDWNIIRIPYLEFMERKNVTRKCCVCEKDMEDHEGRCSPVCCRCGFRNTVSFYWPDRNKPDVRTLFIHYDVYWRCHDRGGCPQCGKKMDKVRDKCCKICGPCWNTNKWDEITVGERLNNG